MHSRERLTPLSTGGETVNPSMPAISRITNSTAARVAAFAMVVGTQSCGGNIDTQENIVNTTGDIGCDPVPSCPRPNLTAHGAYGEETYLSEQRWFRVNPSTGEIVVVCNPTERDFCEPGETPEEDGCSPPVCPGAQDAMCDPVPSREDKHAPYRQPGQANYPTTTEGVSMLPYIGDNPITYPVIFDNTPDCKEGEDPSGDSYYRCDLIPTCETTIPYCEPLRRCEEGEAPVTCSEGGYRYSNIDDCYNHVNNAQVIPGQYGIQLYPGIENICAEQYDPNIDEYYYSPPSITVNCMPVPECGEGQSSYTITRYIDVDCGAWGTWTSEDDYAPSCDPIKSCD